MLEMCVPWLAVIGYVWFNVCSEWLEVVGEPINQTKTKNTTQDNPTQNPHNYWNQHKMGDLHIHLSANQEDYQPFQTYQCKSRI